MKKTRETLYENYYVALFSDGKLGMSDGVGYLDTLSESEVKELYEALYKYFQNKRLEENE